MQRITRSDSPFTFLQQRLVFADRDPHRPWTFFIDNVPQWPAKLPPPATFDQQLVTMYGACRGDEALAQAICDREAHMYDLRLTPEQVLITNGALHGLSLLFRCYYQPEARAVCHAPIITSVAENLQSIGYQVTLCGSSGGELDLDALTSQWDPTVRLIYINTPNNPTGAVCSPATMQGLVQFAQEQHVALIVDAVYDSFVFHNAKVQNPLTLSAAWNQLYVVNSMSKNFGAPGLRIGWIESAAENIEMVAGMLERECIAIAGGAQQYACQLIRGGNQPLVDLVREGKMVAADLLARMDRVEFHDLAGGTQFFAKLPVEDIEAFADYMQLEHGLVVATTSNYVGVHGSFVRIPIGYPKTTIQHALTLLETGLQAWPIESRST